MCTNRLPTPTEMIAYLDRYVHGQSKAKRDISVAMYNHYLGVAQAVCDMQSNAINVHGAPFGRQHVLMMGPTGSGKTYMIKLLSLFLGVPFMTYRANALVRTGYVGTSIESMFSIMLQRCNGNIAQVQRSIVFLDEVDKIRVSGEQTGPDVSGESVQENLLPILDGAVVAAPSRSQGESAIDIDTSSMLFICAGAFVALREIIERRQQAGPSIGFLVERRDQGQTAGDVLSNVSTEDLVEYGLIPEFIGRFGTLTYVDELSVDDLINILLETEGSILPRQKKLFEMHGIDLELADGAVRAIAARAKEFGTGARGLSRLLLKALDDVDYRLPELAAEGASKIIITEETIKGEGNPIIERNAATKRSIPANDLRELALQEVAQVSKDGFTSTEGMSEASVQTLLRDKLRTLGWPNVPPYAKRQWQSFMNDNKERPTVVLRLVEELLKRNASIQEFIDATDESSTTKIAANLHFMDYLRTK